MPASTTQVRKAFLAGAKRKCSELDVPSPITRLSATQDPRASRAAVLAERLVSTLKKLRGTLLIPATEVEARLRRAVVRQGSVRLPRLRSCVAAIFGAVAVTIPAACSSGDSRSTRSQSPDLAEWTLVATPIVSVKAGGEGPDTTGEFVGIVRTTAGIAIAELRNQDIRFYDGRGRLLRIDSVATGTKKRLLSIGRCPGSGLIAAQDFGSQRVAFFGDSGYLLKSIAIPRGLASARLVACFADGSLVFLQPVSANFAKPGISLSRAQLVRVDSAGASRVLRVVGETEYYYSARDKIFVEQPLGKAAMAVSGEREFVAGVSDQETIDLLDLGGNLVRRIDTHLTKRSAVVGDLLEALTLRIYREPSEKTREILRSALVQSPLRPEELLYDQMLTDPHGNIWLKTFELPRREQIRWRVFDGAGNPIGHCDLPADLIVGEIGVDYIAGLQRGVRDPERASVYQLIKRASMRESRDSSADRR